MADTVEQLKAANPDAYEKLEDIFITAAAGRDTTTANFYNDYSREYEEFDIPKSHDGAVSVKSQHAKSLKGLIDYQPSYDVEGNIPHSNEIRNEDFIELIKNVNYEVKNEE